MERNNRTYPCPEKEKKNENDSDKGKKREIIKKVKPYPVFERKKKRSCHEGKHEAKKRREG